jgi:PAS domain S-box-containing protein
VEVSEAQIIEELRARLAEAEETLEAMRSGAVDAMVVEGPDGPRVYTLKGADEPYRILVERMQEGAVTLSEDGTVLFANGGFAAMIGAPLEQVIGSPVARFLLEHERPRFAAVLREARAASVRREFALRRTDGGEVPAMISLGPLPSEDVLAIAMIASDLTEQKQKEEIVAAERFLRSVLEQAAEPIIICDATGRVTHVSRAALSLNPAVIMGQPLAEALPLAPVGTAETRLRAARLKRKIKRVLGGRILSSFEVSLAGEFDEQRHYLLSAGPLHDARERIIGCVVMLTDITARKHAEEHQQILLAELSHRVKNTLASVRSIATQTLRGAASLEAFGSAFDGRLRTLALAHGVLTQTGWSEADLGELIRQSVAPYLTARVDRIRLSGPPTCLPPRQVVTMMLMIHELAVNAAKYGALANDDGLVAINWTIDSHDQQCFLRLQWAERGGPTVRRPDRKGFGTTLIERSISHELDGSAAFHYHPEGLVCDLRFPLDGQVADLLREAEVSAGRLRSDLEARTLS